MIDGIFVGLSTIDIVYGVDEFPAVNRKFAARSQNILVGGPATNAAITFAHLGGKPALFTAVGRNAVANIVRAELKAYAVQLVDLNPEFDGVPALSSVAVDIQGNRNIISANAAGLAMHGSAIDKGVCEQARIVLVDGHYMQACQAWARAAQERKTPVVLDGGSWKDGTEELLRNTQTAICSADFTPPGCASSEEVIRFLKNCGVANVALTKGAEPIQFVSGQSSGTLRVPQVDVVDTVGAGDILHGAYCYFASIGRGFIEALAEAANVASESCHYAGTREWMKHFSPPNA